MSRQTNHIDDYLLARWLSGDATEEEARKVEEWAALSDENREALNDSDKLIESLRQLTIMEGIDSSSAIRKVKQRIDKKEKKKTSNLFIFWQRVAAILVLPLLVYSLLQYFDVNIIKQDDQIVWNEISTPVGLRSAFNLPDGTKVWLNGNTRLKYPLQFKRGERLVELEGEAYFEVVSNKQKPFVVDAGEMLVQAVGTSFNVLAYPDDISLETALVEGKVNLFKETARGRAKVSFLEPGQLAVYNLSTQKLQRYKGNLDKYVAWKEGKILFQNDPLEEVVRKLGQWYNVDFQIAKDVKREYAYTGAFQGEGLHQILEYIELTTPVKFIFSEPKQSNDTTYMKRVITARMK